MQKSTRLLIVTLTAIAGIIPICGGIYLGFSDKFAASNITIFKVDFSSTSVGVTLVFIGAALMATVYYFVLNRLGYSGGKGGNAEVDGDGYAQGGAGGNSGRFGPGGNGGNAIVRGSGKAKGGDAGNGQ